MDDVLRKNIGDALRTARAQTEMTADELFCEVVDLTSLAPPASYCCGLIEGAAQALNVTALELLQDLNIE
jgi:hypothetical protein